MLTFSWALHSNFVINNDAIVLQVCSMVKDRKIIVFVMFLSDVLNIVSFVNEGKVNKDQNILTPVFITACCPSLINSTFKPCALVRKILYCMLCCVTQWVAGSTVLWQHRRCGTNRTGCGPAGTASM